MQISSQRPSSVARDHFKPLASSPSQKRAQHASLDQQLDNQPPSPLLSLPQESLNHITKYLDVPGLLALARTCSALLAHVKDDSTWHSAFNCQFLGDDVEGRHRNVQLLRRVEGSWMKELVYRSNLLNRWERSRSTTIGHTPHYSPIHSMHLLPQPTAPALLTASLQYGVIARSLPLTGKVIKGYITTSNAGLGVGNPNAEFAPNVTACAITTSGNQAKTIWGQGNGEVTVSHTTKVMDHLRATSKLTRCRVEDEHHGRVLDVHWSHDAAYFLTTGVDGVVKVWNADNVHCVWNLQRPTIMPDGPCEKVASDLGQGIVAAALPKGTVLVWVTMDFESEQSFTRVSSNPIQVAIPQVLNPPEGYIRTSCSTLFVGPSQAADKAYLGVHYEGEDEWYRISVTKTEERRHEVVRFKGGPLGPIRTMQTNFTSDVVDSTVFAGDELGRVSVFDWNVHVSDIASSIPSFRRFDAHDEGAISAIACTPCVIVTGSLKGITNVWDALTFALLRTFPSPIARPVSGVSSIIVDKDLLIVSVETRVVAWKGVAVKEKKPRMLKNVGKSRPAVAEKWTKRLELAKDVAECQASLDDEHETSQRTHSRERAQLVSMQDLGLDEIEAVEYVLMLSRDEEEQRRAQQLPPPESITVGDFDEDIWSEGMDGVSVGRVTPVASPALTSRVSSMSDVSRYGSPWNRSPSSTKIQVSPPFRPEPMVAGFSTSPLSISASSRLGRRVSQATPPSLGDAGHFPSMSPSSGSSSPRAPVTRSVSTSPEVKSSSWSAMVKSKVVGSPSGKSGLALNRPSNMASSNLRSSAGPSLLSESLRNHSIIGRTAGAGQDEDEDLRLALELSLAESLSMQQLN